MLARNVDLEDPRDEIGPVPGFGARARRGARTRASRRWYEAFRAYLESHRDPGSDFHAAESAYGERGRSQRIGAVQFRERHARVRSEETTKRAGTANRD